MTRTHSSPVVAILHLLLTSLLACLIVSPLVAAPPKLERIAISSEGDRFIFQESKKKFVPWGFNYDRDWEGRLLEDYWEKEWSKVEEAFETMKQLKATVVRVHLQFGKFMRSPTESNPESLAQLQQLLKLAERTGLYLDVTGLCCYHKADVPDWYDKLSEEARWEAQANFWKAIATECASSPAVFCYNLMNEPVVAAGSTPREDWLAGAFGGKHYVQFINLANNGRVREEIAKAWIGQLTKGIREADPGRLITVGLVDWSLDRPGLKSGFVPEKIHHDLDFLAVHLYPETGKLDEAIEILSEFAKPGKLVIIEETFPMKCSLDDLGEFFDRSREHADGWIGFYWGQSIEPSQVESSFVGAVSKAWLDLFQKKTPEFVKP